MQISSGSSLLATMRKDLRSEKSGKRLASGLRINSAADDSSGMAVSEKMKAQIRGLTTAESNVQDSISLVQAADGALEEVHTILQRLRELSTKAANGIYSEEDRSAIQEETDHLLLQIDQISKGTTFNNLSLLDGSSAISPSIPGKPAVYEADIDFDKAQEGSYITIGDVKFEFDVSGTLSDPRAVPVDISAAADGAARAEAFKLAVKNSEAAQKFNINFNGNGDPLRIRLEATEAVGGEKVNVEYKTVMDVKFDIWNFTSDDGKVRICDFDYIDPSTLQNGSTFVVDNIVFEFYDKVPANLHNPVPPYTQVVGIKLGPTKLDTYIEFSDAIYNTLTTPSFSRTAVVAIDTGSNPETWTLSIGDYLDLPDPPAAIQSMGFNLGASVANKMAGTNIVEKAGVSEIPSKSGILLQVGADGFETMRLNISGVGVSDLELADLSLQQAGSASEMMAKIDKAIGKVSLNRAGLGAAQNRLEYAANNLLTGAESLTAANSRITDADIAKEMTTKSIENVRMQGAQALLAQSNQYVKDVLRVLE